MRVASQALRMGDENIISMRISFISAVVLSRLERKCRETVVSLDILLELSIVLRFSLNLSSKRLLVSQMYFFVLQVK